MSEIPNTPVDSVTLLRVLRWLSAAGFEFVLDQSPHGCSSLTPLEVLAYLRNPDAYLARAMDVSVEDYRGWKESEGGIQCHARTKGGRRCRNMVAQAYDYLTPQKWAALQATQPTCWVHGGRAITARERWGSAE
jgi:hypothetical protein